MMESRPSLSSVVQSAIDTARDSFERNGEVSGLFVVHAANEMIGIPAHFTNDVSKDILATLVREVCRQKDAYACVFMTEAYRTVVEKEGGAVKKPRAEVVMIVVEHFSSRRPVYIEAQIKRAIPGDESSPGTLTPFVQDTKGTSLGGRFANMLPGAGGN